MPRFAKYEENEEPIAGYKLVDFLGAGQFGEVWKAVDTESGIFVAIKLIDLSHSTSALKELKALNLVRNLRHPNLVPIFTARLKDKNGKEHPLHKADEVKNKGQLRELVIAMGLGDRSLSARLKQLNPDGTDPDDFKGIPYEELISYMEGAAKGIDYLNKTDHGLGKGVGDGPIIHCDIKPDNMMVVAGEVQIADCGVAVIITPDARQTKAAGSPAYSAPELTGNKPVPGTDQYALAISYYELRTGKLPFDESMGQLSIMLAHAEGRLDFSSPVLSEYETRVLKWATAVQPKQRYPSCIDMVKQLTRAQYDLPPLAPDQLGVKSGVVSVPLNRSKKDDKPAPPKPAAKTTSDASKGTQKFDPQPAPVDELRGTVIPDSDRMLPPSQAGFTLPPVEAPPTDTRRTGGRTTPSPEPPGPAARYQASQSEILLPLGDEGLPDDFDPDADEATIVPDTRAPGPVAAGPADTPTTPVDYEQSLIVERPKIPVDPDDIQGKYHQSIELDPEIKAILRKSAPIGTPPPREAPAPQVPPAARTTSAPVAPRPASNPVIIPPVAPGKRSTQYPRETPSAADVDVDPPSETEPKSLPTWAKEAERERLRSTGSGTADVPAALQTDWRKESGPAPKTGGGLPAKLLVGGVLLGGLVAGGFFLTQGNKGGPDTPTPPAPPPSGGGKEPPPPPPPSPEDAVRKDLLAVKEQIEKARGNEAAIDAAEAEFKTVADKIEALPLALRATLKPELGETRSLFDRVKQGVTIVRIETILAKDMPTDPELDEAESLVAKLPEALRGDVVKYTGKIKFFRAANKMRGLAEELKAAGEKPADQFGPAAKAVLDKADDDQKKDLARQLIKMGTPADKVDYREKIIDLVSPPGAFGGLVPDKADRDKVFEWQAELLMTPFKAAKAALEKLATGVAVSQPDLAAAQEAVTALRNAVAQPATRFGAAWDAKTNVPTDIAAFLAAADAWSKARGKPADLRPFAEFFRTDKLAALPAPNAPFLLEYMRLAADTPSRSIPALRALRDEAPTRWPTLTADELKRLDALFQNALALQVRDDVSTPDPKWPAVRTLLDKDPANGWAKLTAAEQALLGNDKTVSVPDLVRDGEAFPTANDPTANERAVYVSYLRGLATTTDRGEALAALYRPAEKLPTLLTPEFRRKAAAEAIFAGVASGQKKLDDLRQLLTAHPNPYDRDPKALERLQIAHRLAGKDHPDWTMHLALLTEAAGDKAGAAKVANDVKFDDTTLPDDQVPAALAFYLEKATNTDLRDDSRTPAYAAAGRLAIRAMNRSFGPYKTMKPFYKAETEFSELIQTKIVEPANAIKGGSAGDKASLRLTQYRVGSPPKDVAVVDEIVRDLRQDNHADLPTAYGYRAEYAFFTFTGDSGTAWEQIHADINAALAKDPNNFTANRALAYVSAAEFGQYSGTKPPAEKVRAQTDYAAQKKDTLRAVAAFDKACAGLQTRKESPLWLLRAKFLRAAANDFAFAYRAPDDKGPAVDIKALLTDAQKAVQTAQEQRDPGPKGKGNDFGQRHDESLLEGRILEDLARLTQSKATKDYQAALAKMKFEGTREAAEEYESLVDMARCTIRAVESGAFDESRLKDAEDFLKELAEAEKTAAAGVKPSVQRYLRDGQLWRGVLHHARKEYGPAEDAFKKAMGDFEGKNAEANLLATLLAYRGENALDALAAKDMTEDKAAEIVTACKDAFDKLPKGGKFVDRGAVSFVPDYLSGRLAALQKKAGDAGSHFQAAYLTIRDARSALRVDHGFAVRCLAHALGHLGDEAPMAKQLLARLDAQYKWGQSAADRKLIADALK